MGCESCRRRPARFWVTFGTGTDPDTATGFAVCGDCLIVNQDKLNGEDWVTILRLSA